MTDDVIRNDPPAVLARPGLTSIAERVSWGAVWAGVMAALGMEVLFTLFGLFIGSVCTTGAPLTRGPVSRTGPRSGSW